MFLKATAAGAPQPFYKDQAPCTVLARPKISKPDINIQQQPIFSLLPRNFYHVMDMTSLESSLEPPTPAPAFMFDQTDVVTLHVGPTDHVMIAHASYITHNSDFFKAALKKEWLEGQTRVIKLPDDRPDVVSHYLYYTYSKALPSAPDSDPIDDGNFERNRFFKLLAEIYVLGERLQDQSIRTAVIESTVASWDYRLLITGPADIIYRGTTAGSPARRLMVDLFLAYGDECELDDRCEPDFLCDVARAFCSKASSDTDPKSFRDHPLNAADYSSDSGRDIALE
jgi:hypothetical protein